MAGSLHQDLHIFGPGPLGEMAQLNQLCNLPGVGAVVDAARAQGVAQADGHVVFPQNV